MGKNTRKELLLKIEKLQSQLKETKDTLDAIRNGQVDAIVVGTPGNEQIYTLKGADYTYRILMENMSEGAFIMNADGIILYCNRCFGRILKRPLEKLMGTSFPQFILKEDQTKYNQLIKQAHKNHAKGELTLIAEDSTKLLVNLSINSLQMDDALIFCVVVSDLTEKKLYERLIASEKLIRSIFEQVPDAIVVCNKEGLITKANKVAQKLCRQNPIMKPFDTAFPLKVDRNQKLPFVKDDEGRFALAKPLLAGEGLRNIEAFLKPKEGNPYELIISAAPLLNEQNEVNGAVITMTDVTELKKANKKISEYSKNLKRMVENRTRELQRALHDTEEARDKIDGILKSVGDGLIVTDIYNRVVLMNRAAEDLLGVRLSEVINRPIDFAIKDKTLRDKFKETLNKKKTGTQFDFELPGENTKYPRIMRARISVIYDKTGKQTGIVTIIYDVTHEREMDRLKTEFISIAAHELRTPLTSIQGFSEILLTRSDLKEEEKKQFLSYINKQSKHLANIINTLLDISRIESGKGLIFNKAPCNINEIITETVGYFRAFSQKHQFEVSLPEKSVELMVDKEKMRQVLENIISNAIKYSPEGGIIEVNGQLLEDHYQVSVQDQGIGIPPEHIEKIFDKFYRVDTSNTSVSGIGLGMSIVKDIVEAHGGRIWVESELGKGTTVIFTIPRR